MRISKSKIIGFLLVALNCEATTYTRTSQKFLFSLWFTIFYILYLFSECLRIFPLVAKSGGRF